MLDRSDLEILKDYFNIRDHEFLQGRAYITEAAITTRIEEVDPAWSFAIIESKQRGDRIIITANLTIKDVSRDGVGMAEIRIGKAGNKEVNDAEKSAATDALKRCARLFGVGRYLLTMGQSVRDANSLSRWIEGQTVPNQDSPPEEKAPTPIEDVVIHHWVKATPVGKKYHVMKTAEHGNKTGFMKTTGK